MAENVRRPKKIKVLIVLDNLNLGGAERQAIGICNHLNKGEHFEVQITALSPQGNLLGTNADLSTFVPVKPFTFHSNFILRIFEMMRYSIRLRKLKPDILIPFTIRPNMVVNFAWQLTGAKKSFWNQRDEGFGFPEQHDRLFDQSFKNASAYIANSSSSRNTLATYSRKTEGRIYVIPNGVFSTQITFPPSHWANQFPSHGKLIAAMVANLTDKKDHETVIRAWGHLKNELKSKSIPLLILVGKKAETYPRIKALIDELNLTNEIILSDFIDDITGFLSIVDITIHSSVSEGMPNSILEFMSRSKPVVASNILAHQEVLGEEYPYYFTIGDYPKLAELIISLSKDDNARRTIGEENYNRYEQQFTFEKMMTSYERLLKTPINQIGNT